MSEIFISYRRLDNAHAAGRLYDELSSQIGSSRVFMDIDNIAPGVDFVRVLQTQMANCKVMLAVIGLGWLNAADQKGNLRLWSSRDFVRLEIEAALSRDIPVVPVLVDGASMPDVLMLPKSLQPLCTRNAVVMSHERFRSDTADLVRGLRPFLGRPSFFGVLARFLRPRPGSVPTPISPPARTANTSLLDEFVQTCVIQVGNGSVSESELFGAYTHWCARRNALPLSQAVFLSSLSDLNAKKVKVSGRVRFCGIALRTNDLNMPLTDAEAFYRDRVAGVEGKTTTLVELYEAYCEWCDANSKEPMIVSRFGSELSLLGLRKERIAGRVRWLNVGLKTAASVPQSNKAESPDGQITSVQEFYLDSIRPDDNASMTAVELYEEYASWCDEMGKEPLALPVFGRKFAELGVRKERIAGRVRYLGITLRS